MVSAEERDVRRTWSAPAERASAALASVETVPMTLAPRYLAICILASDTSGACLDTAVMLRSASTFQDFQCTGLRKQVKGHTCTNNNPTPPAAALTNTQSPLLIS